MHFAVYLPRRPERSSIDLGSGIVGTPQEGLDRILIDYEGNRFGAANMVTYADRVHHAAGRHAANYPTIARSLIPAEDVVVIGTYDDHTGEVTLLPAEDGQDDPRTLLAVWCGISEDVLDAQLLTQGSATHQMRREVRAGLASPDPARRFAAEQMNRRYQLEEQ